MGNCSWSNGIFVEGTSIATVADPNDVTGGTGASNTLATNPGCGPTSGPVPELTGIQNFDLLGNRYINLANCAWNGGGFIDSTSIASVGDPNHATGGTGTSNTLATAPACGPASGLVPELTGIQNIDTLDQTRGQGFVQFQMTAPITATTVTATQTGSLTGPGTGNPTSSGTITVQAATGTPLLTSGPTGIAAIAALGALFAMVVAWRRRAHR